MANRIFNFSAGPAMLPTEVLEKSAAALLDYQGKGFGIAESAIAARNSTASSTRRSRAARQLLGLGDTHDVLFLQGGATQLFTLIPMNFLHGTRRLPRQRRVEQEGGVVRQGGRQDQRRRHAARRATSTTRPQPSEWKLTDGADYFHVCSNETVHGHRLPTWPKHPNLIVDASSEFMSRPHPVERLRAGLRRRQKNLGPSGVVLAIVRKDLYAKQKKVAEQAVELQGPGREQVDDQHAADVRRVHPARSLPLARSAGRPGRDGEAQRRPRPS